MMKIDVCIILGNFMVNPKLIFNWNFHAIVNFDYLSWRWGEPEKLKKGVEVQVFLKKEGEAGTSLI